MCLCWKGQQQLLPESFSILVSLQPAGILTEKKKKKKSQYCVDKSRNVNLWQTYSWVLVLELILDSNDPRYDPRWSATFLF